MKKRSLLSIVIFSVLALSGSFQNSRLVTFAENKSTPTFSIDAIKPAYEGKLTFIDVEGGREMEGKLQLSIIDAGFRGIFRMDKDIYSSNDFGAKNKPTEWISFPDNLEPFEVESGKNAIIPVKIKVPKGTVPGDYRFHISAIMTEFFDLTAVGKAEEKKEKVKSGGISIGAKVSFGSGLQVLVRVKGKVDLNAKLKGFRHSVGTDGKLKLIIECTNDSTVSIIPIAKVEVIDAISKKSIFSNTYDLQTAGPKGGCGGELILEKPKGADEKTPGLKLSYGWYDAKVELEYIMLDYLTPREELPIKKAGKATLRIYQIPTKIILYSFLLIFGCIVILAYRSYSRKKLLSISKIYTVQNGDTVQSIAVQFSLDPTIIIKLNKLKFPFMLAAGQKLFIPIYKK